MGSVTARLALPYPTGTDRVMDGDDAIRALAEGLDFNGARVSASIAPWGGASAPIRKPITQFGPSADVTSALGSLVYTFPQAFTSQVFFVAATTIRGAPYNPVVDNGGITLTSVQLHFPTVAVSTSVQFVVMAVGI